MNHARLAGLALGLVAVGGVGTAAIAGNGPENVRTQPVAATAHSGAKHGVDPRIEVPPGNRLAGVLDVERGVQTYQCTNRAWTFLEPSATLVNRRGVAVVLHSRGPVWISTVDGSAVNAAAVPGASVPREGAVPELLLKATATRGEGALGRVSFIQRLRTKGGLAPTGSCTDGAQVGVPYQAVYRFYVPATQ